MADLTCNITSVYGDYTNKSPLKFDITFSSSVSDFELDDIIIVNGNALKLSGSGSEYTVSVSADYQNVECLVKVPANSCTSDSDSNIASNIAFCNYLTIKAKPKLDYNPSSISSDFIIIKVSFDREIISFDKSKIKTNNCSIKSLERVSASEYTLKLQSKDGGQVTVSIGDNACKDLYGNDTMKSTEINFYVPSSSTITSPSSLMPGFNINEIVQVQQINTINDCVRSLPQRLLEKAKEKAFELVMNSDSGKKIVGTVMIVGAAVENVQSIIKIVKSIDVKKNLAEMLLEAKMLTGTALTAKLLEITNTFGDVSGINDMLKNLSSLDICKVNNVNSSGAPVQQNSLMPSDNKPSPITGVAEASASSYDSGPKDRYDELMFKIKEITEVGSIQLQTSERSKMISVLVSIVTGYHDDIAKTTDSSRDESFYIKYKTNVNAELKRNNDWSSEVKEQFTNKTNTAGELIKASSEQIRAYMNRNATPVIGDLISTGVTTYSGPGDDYTTFLDIKLSQRPPELTAKYKAMGYKIPTGSTYTNSKNKTMKIGTLNYSDVYNGAYGKPLISDKVVASTRFPGGSVIALKNPDGTPYDPTGKNPSGLLTVTDTGNLELTYQKPDIFTLTPELYKNTGSVKVYLVSMGNQTKGKYATAKAKYGINKV